MDVIITISCLMIAASILFLTSIYFQKKADKEYRRQIIGKRKKEEREQKIGIILEKPVDEFSEGDIKMFYKAKDGNILNLNKITAISTFDSFQEGGYTVMLESGPNFVVEKEDYEDIIKHLNIVNEGDK